MQRLGDSARELLESQPPAVALRQWMSLFADWAATKHGMIDALRSMIAAGDLDAPASRAIDSRVTRPSLVAKARAATASRVSRLRRASAVRAHGRDELSEAIRIHGIPSC